jgi:alkylation response protein AidB-like acyl-CoA dehydrogenase
MATNATTEKILTRIRALEPTVTTARERMEKEASMPPEIIEGMIRADIFKAGIPKVYGGLELDPASQMRIVEECARLDGSVGWLAMIGVSGGHLAAFPEPGQARDLFGHDAAICAGQASFTGQRAEVAPGGYRVSGHFRFGSGIDHASVLFCGVALCDKGQPLLSDDGKPRMRMLLIPTARAKIIRNWDTLGMRGTGSHDFELEDVFVPESATFDMNDPPKVESPLYRYKTLFLVYHAGVPLGIARAVLDEARALCTTKRVAPLHQLLRDDPRTQECIGRAEATLAAARSHCYGTLADLWATLCAGQDLSLEQRIANRLMMVYVHEASKKVVDDIVNLVSTSSIVHNSVFDRGLRDITTACQHRQSHTRLYSAGGRAYLGLEQEYPWF